MANEVKVKFEKREATGTGVCRKIRNEKLIPAVLYGPDYKEGLAGTVEAKPIYSVANGSHSETTLIELSMGGSKTAKALIREVQRHPISREIRHVDFYEIVKGHKIRVEVPTKVLNAEKAPGVKEGGVLAVHMRSILLEVEPSNIPEEILIDAAEFEVGKEVFVKDLDLPKDISAIAASDALVLQIAIPRAFEEPEAEETAEVEVVEKGKKAEGEAEAQAE